MVQEVQAVVVAVVHLGVVLIEVAIVLMVVEVIIIIDQEDQELLSSLAHQELYLLKGEVSFRSYL
jgi:hypothetical protein